MFSTSTTTFGFVGILLCTICYICYLTMSAYYVGHLLIDVIIVLFMVAAFCTWQYQSAFFLFFFKILFQLSNILNANTIFNCQAIHTHFKHHSYIGEIYVFTYNKIKINKNIKTNKKHFKIEFW